MMMQPMGGASSMEMRNSPFPPPPQAPTLTDFPLSDAGEEPSGQQAATGASLLKAGQAINEMLDSIARSAPKAAEKLDRIKTALKGVIAELVVPQKQEMQPQAPQQVEGSSPAY